MTVIVREDVEVSDTETEIIEPHETDKERPRTFIVSNGDYEIEAKAWGSNDQQNWEERDSKVISANNVDKLIVGPTICWVKLIGKTTSSGETSIVDAMLKY